ncbi:YhcN/YlaJ family sporulation lipoprotein [Bacillus infantis]|uniref:YhcN/YlaJ family sporulation lipoprotein n=1 Tax=Bacillus infantis TaxID=324767 RepID=UPI002002DDFD|nr:YhcN/YlaJ family sporulation lipoprotein [Bacillus infantis]MCK6208064.1 YhcN/YlaJ family sporulation lipoprotein [Bacillus infantis]
MKKLRWLLIGAAASVLITGCASSNQGSQDRNDGQSGTLSMRNVTDSDATDDANNLLDDEQNNNKQYNNGLEDNGQNGNEQNGSDQNDLRNSEDAQQKVEAMKEVDKAVVITAGSKAYAAVKLANEENADVNDEMKKKVSDQVQAADQNINEVFVSSNPDFMERMRGYRDDIQNGNPVRGLFDQFSETVQRIFPESR